MFRKLSIVVAVLLLIASMGYAATYSDFVSGNNRLSQSAYQPQDEKSVWVQSRYINLGDSNFNSGSGVTNGDVVRCLTVPAGTIITEVGIYVVTGPIASASGVSATLGDGADPNGYCTELDFTAGGTTVWYTRGSLTNLSATKAGAYNNISGVSLYDGEDTIDLVFLVDQQDSTSGCTPAFYIWARGFVKPTQ